MMHKRKKNTRQQGSKTWGWGAMKKHRGKGNKGGAGMAGSGKRGDAKKPANWNDKKYFGKYGFKRKKKEQITISIARIEQKYITEAEKGLDLTKFGFNKLLGQGTPTKKYNITIAKASKKAIEKIKKAGGTVTLAETPEAEN